MKLLSLLLITILLIEVKSKKMNFVEKMSIEASKKIPELLGEHSWRVNYEGLCQFSGERVSEIKLAGVIETMKNVAEARINDKKKLYKIRKLYKRTFDNISLKPVESEVLFDNFNKPKNKILNLKSKAPVSNMFKNAAKKVIKRTNKITSNVAEISTKNVIGNIAEKCTRSGCKQVTTAAKKTAKEVTKKSGSKLFEKLGTAVTIGLAAYEGYGDYHENGDVGRAVVRTTASLGKNSLISAAMVPVSALCGPFATACFIGGTVGISSYTPDAKWLTDKLYE